MNFLKKVKHKIQRVFKKKDFRLVYDKENNEWKIDSAEKITLRLGNQFHLIIDGDYDTSVNGECNLLTYNKNINIDSFKAKIYFNSMMSKQVRGLQEAIDYRKKWEKRNARNKSYKRKTEDADDFFKEVVELFGRVEALEKKYNQKHLS